MIRASETINDLAAALAQAQAALENVTKDATNPGYKSRYATLSSVLDEVRPKLAAHGLSVMQMPVNGDGTSVGVVTRLMHSSGQWIESAFFVTPTKTDAQGAGSALTYCRRYSLMAVAGIAPEDDDGNAAVEKPQGQSAMAMNRQASAAAMVAAASPRPAAVTRAEPPAPPVWQEPHAIPGSLSDYLPVPWGKQFIQAVLGSRSQADVDGWERNNEAILQDIRQKHPNAWRSIERALAQTRAALGPDPEPEYLGADEATQALPHA